MKIWIFCFVFLTSSLFSFSLKDKFEEAEEGTYIVTEQNQLVSLLHLHTKQENKLLFEEISIPLHLAKKIKWEAWVRKGAPGHTSWILYEVDLEKNCVTECYSKTRKSWIPTEEMAAFLIPLISLKLDYLSEEERLQTGPAAKAGAVTGRPWGPPQVIQGKKVKGPEYDVYTAKWPIDDSDLSGKPIVLYFDKNQKGFPFPYWLQIREGALKFKMRAVDSGTGLVSPSTEIPRRSPQFTGSTHKENGQLLFSLRCPLYYDNLQLYAVDMTESPRLTHLIPFEKKAEGEALTLKIDQKKLDAMFTSGHEYLWIVSSESSGMAVESPHLYTQYSPEVKNSIP